MQYERKPTPKGMILDICSMRSRAIKLMKFENEYNPLLKVITEKDYYYDENLKFPSLKEFAILADIKTMLKYFELTLKLRSIKYLIRLFGLPRKILISC